MKSHAVCHLLLAHLPPGEVARLIRRWSRFCPPPSQVMLCYGGSQENFAQIAHEPKIFIDDPRLRTRDHQRERQSYTRIFQKASAWLRDRPQFGYVYFAEFDHWPVAKDFEARLIERLQREGADVLAHQLARRDQTSCVYYLSHLNDPRFLPWLRQISRRAEPAVVLNMFGSGSFWTREAFLSVGEAAEPFPMYLETYLPTLAHHLGFRVRDFQEQNRFVSVTGDRYAEIEPARQSGAWTIHPVKTWPTDGELID